MKLLFIFGASYMIFFFRWLIVIISLSLSLEYWNGITSLPRERVTSHLSRLLGKIHRLSILHYACFRLTNRFYRPLWERARERERVKENRFSPSTRFLLIPSSPCSLTLWLGLEIYCPRDMPIITRLMDYLWIVADSSLPAIFSLRFHQSMVLRKIRIEDELSRVVDRVIFVQR